MRKMLPQFLKPEALQRYIGRAGVPMEVMGLMLGEFVDEYTVRVVDVFAMPQSGTGVSVEVVDHVFQTNMLDMLKQTGRPEMVVGWYHSHPGFGCWLSGVDINTQQVLEREEIMNKYHEVTAKLEQALSRMSHEKLDISDEAKEQVELVLAQFRIAKGRVENPDFELYEDLSSLYNKSNDAPIDPTVMRRLSEKLQLMGIKSCS